VDAGRGLNKNADSQLAGSTAPELTPFGAGPTFVFDAVASGAAAKIIRTPLMSPEANAHVERMIGSVRRECLDHLLVHNELHLQRVLNEYRRYFNEARPPGNRAAATERIRTGPACGRAGPAGHRRRTTCAQRPTP
jgi:hypothetical protein